MPLTFLLVDQSSPFFHPTSEGLQWITSFSNFRHLNHFRRYSQSESLKLSEIVSNYDLFALPNFSGVGPPKLYPNFHTTAAAAAPAAAATTTTTTHRVESKESALGM